MHFFFFQVFNYLHIHCSLFKLSLQVKLSAMFFHRNSQASIKMVTHNIFGSIHLWLVQIRVKPSYHWDALILLKQDTSKKLFFLSDIWQNILNNFATNLLKISHFYFVWQACDLELWVEENCTQFTWSGNDWKMQCQPGIEKEIMQTDLKYCSGNCFTWKMICFTYHLQNFATNWGKNSVKCLQYSNFKG